MIVLSLVVLLFLKSKCEAQLLTAFDVNNSTMIGPSVVYLSGQLTIVDSVVWDGNSRTIVCLDDGFINFLRFVFPFFSFFIVF